MQKGWSELLFSDVINHQNLGVKAGKSMKSMRLLPYSIASWSQVFQPKSHLAPWKTASALCGCGSPSFFQRRPRLRLTHAPKVPVLPSQQPCCRVPWVPGLMWFCKRTIGGSHPAKIQVPLLPTRTGWGVGEIPGKYQKKAVLWELGKVNACGWSRIIRKECKTLILSGICIC